jgi:hypothetical protein
MTDVDPADLGNAVYDLLEAIRRDRPRMEAQARARALDFNRFVANAVAGMVLDKFHGQRIWHPDKAK